MLIFPAPILTNPSPGFTTALNPTKELWVAFMVVLLSIVSNVTLVPAVINPSLTKSVIVFVATQVVFNFIPV